MPKTDTKDKKADCKKIINSRIKAIIKITPQEGSNNENIFDVPPKIKSTSAVARAVSIDYKIKQQKLGKGVDPLEGRGAYHLEEGYLNLIHWRKRAKNKISSKKYCLFKKKK